MVLAGTGSLLRDGVFVIPATLIIAALAVFVWAVADCARLRCEVLDTLDRLEKMP